ALSVAALAHAAQRAGQLADDLVLPAAQLVEIDLWRAKIDAVFGEDPGLVHHRRDVQQRIRRNPADVEAHATQGRIALDQHRLHAEIGRAKSSAIAAGARAQ